MNLLRRLGLAALFVLALGSHVRGFAAVFVEELACRCVGCVMDREPLESPSCCVDEEAREPSPSTPVASSPASEGCPCAFRPLDEGKREPLAASSDPAHSKARAAHLALGSAISARSLAFHAGRAVEVSLAAGPPGERPGSSPALCSRLRLSAHGDAWSVAVLGQALI